MMSVSVQTPSTTFSFSSIDSLSPPPTPGKKRACYSNISELGPMPAFLSTSKSLLVSSEHDEHDEQLERVAEEFSFPPLPNNGSFSLRPRPMFGTKMPQAERRNEALSFLPSEMPPLPFSFPNPISPPSSPPSPQSMARQIPPLPSFSGSDGSNSPATPPAPLARKSLHANNSQRRSHSDGSKKLPAFQRQGMFHQQKRNSLVARCA